MYLIFFSIYINIYALNQKDLQSSGIHIYVAIYLGTKNMHIKYEKNNLKNNIKIKTKTKRKKIEQILNFKCNINVKTMTSREHQKSCALHLLVSIN